jgi:cationic amino acid transporter 1
LFFHAALFACLFNLQDLVDLMALATLFAFALVAACIIVLRYQPEENITTASESGEVTGLLAGVAQNQIRYVSDSSVESQTVLRQIFVQRGRLPTGFSGKVASWLTVVYGIFHQLF